MVFDRSTIRLAIGFWALAGFAFFVAGTADSGTIERILIEGNQRISEETIRSWISVQPGDPLDKKKLQKEFQSLWDRQVFNEITIESRDTGTGTVVIFHLREKPVLSNVSYEGLKSISVSQLEETLERVKANLPIGSPVSHSRIQRTQEVIRQMLRENGFRSPSASYELIPITRSQQELRFQIEEGPKTKIREVVFEGNRSLKTKKLKKAMRFTKQHSAFKFFSKKDTLHESALQSDLERVERFYASEGYLNAQIGPGRIEGIGPKKEFSEPPPEPLAEGKKKKKDKKEKKKKNKKKEWVRILIPVDEGLQFRVGKLDVQGNTVFSDQEILARIPLKEGEIFNDSALNLGLSRLELDYGERGYFYVTTNKILDRKTDGVADVRVDIREDEQYYVRRIEFRGNTSTRDSVLRREFQLNEEELFDVKKFQIARRRINQLGYWRVTREPEILPLRDENKVDIFIDGKEESRNEIQVGGGVSGADGAFFTGSYATSNFLGRGEIFQSFLQVGGRRNLFNFSFIEPYLFGKKLTAGFSLFRRETEFVGFNQRSKGGSIQLGRRIGNFSRFDVTYLFENIEFQEQGRPTDNSTTSSVIPVYTLDTRNNFFKPTRGFRFRLAGEFAGGFLGGDNYFIKPIVQTTWFLPVVKKTYLGLNLEVGFVEPFGTLNGVDREVPIFERFFLGGDRSLRAFQTRSISPVRTTIIDPIDIDGDGDFQDEDINGNGVFDTEDANRNGLLDPGEDLNGNGVLDSEDIDGDGILDQLNPGGSFIEFPGGNKFIVFNGEYVFQVGNTVELALFLDTGNAFDDDESIQLDDLRLDYGLEARFYLPVFQAPLRLIYGIIQDPRPGEDKTNFQFSIGRTF